VVTRLLRWLDRADRDALTVHHRGDETREPQGVFATRSPDRPNPIGLRRVRVESIDGGRIQVRARGTGRYAGARP
jgi:tRNA (Thr-GGU) A37 N-methylase